MIGTANDIARIILGLKIICNVLCHVIFVKGQGLCMNQQGSCLLIFIISLSACIFVDVVRRGCDSIALCNIEHP